MSTKKTSLLQIIDEQKQDIEKYKSKLRDIVAAHRGLIKEKEALEQSLNALQTEKGSRDDGSADGRPAQNATEDAKQVAALVGSLTTLTAAKTKMETSFQADKKQLREDKETAERKRDELLETVARLELEIEDWKSKVIVERHERDKEQTDHGAMMKELQNLLASERRQRLNLEEALSEQRKRQGDVGVVNMEKYERRMERLQNELDMTRRKLELCEKKGKEPPRELSKLQDEIRNLQVEHQTAIEQERQRAEQVEERAKRQALVQEERVMNLETRLAELSASVGTYDRLRQQDQTEILKLKEHLAAVSLGSTADNRPAEASNVTEKEAKLQHSEKPRAVKDPIVDVHAKCAAELDSMRRELEQCRAKSENAGSGRVPGLEGLVRSLQDRIRVISEEANIRDKQHKLETENLKQTLRTEKARSKDTLAAAETDFRGRLNLLETQLQKLRERSMAMLEDKEQEIHSLQGTFQAFLPGAREKEPAELPHLTSMRDGPRMLHYANELARRDVDIATLRRGKHKLEGALRDLQRAASADAEAHREERQTLREEIARLNRCQTRGGANLEYLKNVVLSFLLTTDPCSKRHMANAIAAVLKFSDEEQDKISKQSHNSWWTVGKT